jgi:hypothetical protein
MVAIGGGGSTVRSWALDWPQSAPTAALIAALPRVNSSGAIIWKVPLHGEITGWRFGAPPPPPPPAVVHEELLARLERRALRRWEYAALVWVSARRDRSRPMGSDEWGAHFIPLLAHVHLLEPDGWWTPGARSLATARRLVASASLQCLRVNDLSEAIVLLQYVHWLPDELQVRAAGGGEEDWLRFWPRDVGWSDGVLGPLGGGSAPRLDVRYMRLEGAQTMEAWRTTFDVQRQSRDVEGEWRLRIRSDRAVAQRARATRYWVGEAELPLYVNASGAPRERKDLGDER